MTHPFRCLASIAFVALASIAVHAAPPPIFGFSTASADHERRLEGRFLKLPSEARVQEDHRFLTLEPHLAGSANASSCSKVAMAL
jgi:hypothetical protein